MSMMRRNPKLNSTQPVIPPVLVAAATWPHLSRENCKSKD